MDTGPGAVSFEHHLAETLARTGVDPRPALQGQPGDHRRCCADAISLLAVSAGLFGGYSRWSPSSPAAGLRDRYGPQSLPWHTSGIDGHVPRARTGRDSQAASVTHHPRTRWHVGANEVAVGDQDARQVTRTVTHCDRHLPHLHPRPGMAARCPELHRHRLQRRAARRHQGQAAGAPRAGRARQTSPSRSRRPRRGGTRSIVGGRRWRRHGPESWRGVLRGPQGTPGGLISV